MTTKDDSYDENLTAAEAAVAREWAAFKRGMVAGGLVGAGLLLILFALSYPLWSCQ